MPVPPAACPAMLLLGSIDLGFALRTGDGRLAVDVPGAEVQPVPAGVLDDLEERGWIDLAGEEPALTEKGRYWLSRWADKHHRKRVG